MIIWHLVKRSVESLVARPLGEAERRHVAELLLAGELAFFERLAVADQRHAIGVLRRFDVLQPGAPATARRAALLHDIGKVDCGLGTIQRVIATVIGPRTETFRRYHNHERIGIELLESAGSHPETLALLRGMGSPVVVEALRRADNL
jgi:hypothetical protein